MMRAERGCSRQNFFNLISKFLLVLPLAVLTVQSHIKFESKTFILFTSETFRPLTFLKGWG